MYSNAITNSRCSSEVSVPDSLSNLKSYDWKHRRSASEVAELMKKLPLTSDTEYNSSKGDAEDKRIGNTDWCRCGFCKPMDTYTQSLCYAETNEE